MSRPPVLALVAEMPKEGGSSGYANAEVQRAALAVQRAVLVRGGRILLSADGAALVTLLVAGAELQPLRRVEGDARPTASLIVFPFPDGNAFEDRLIDLRQELREGLPPTTLLEQLMSTGLAEFWHDVESSRADTEGMFSRALKDLEVRAVFAIGGGDRAWPLLEAAESYQSSAPSARISLVQSLNLQKARGGAWSDLSQWLEAFSKAPPVFEGEPLRDHVKDERLAMIGQRAADDAALALAIDRAIEELIGEEPQTGSDPGRALA